MISHPVPISQENTAAMESRIADADELKADMLKVDALKVDELKVDKLKIDESREDALKVASVDSIAQQKFALRRTLLAERRALPAALRAQWNLAIGARILEWSRTQQIGALGVYQAIQAEPDLSDCYARLAAAGVQLALPVVVAADAPLRFAAWRPGDALVKDALGVLIPATLDWVGALPALLIPCLGFNAARCRLGYGGGYYDRTLAPAPRPLGIGIAYAGAQVEFATEAHDIALDMIVTEAG